MYYEDDGIIRCLFARLIKYKIENEFYGNLDKIVDIKIKQSKNRKDLIVEAYYRISK